MVSYFDLGLDEFTLVDGIWIRGFVAGTGKSFIDEYFTQMNKRVLFESLLTDFFTKKKSMRSPITSSSQYQWR